MKLRSYPAIFLAIFFVLIGGLVYYFSFYRDREAKKTYSEALERYSLIDASGVDAVKASKDIENALEKAGDSLDQEEEGRLKSLLGDSLLIVDTAKGIEILKEVAENSEYPGYLRVIALTYIADNYELDFIDRNFSKEVLFSGENFGRFLLSSNSDVGLAMRKLNEWSDSLFPNVSARYRIALWYAEESLKPSSGALEREESIKKAKQYLEMGDSIFAAYREKMAPQRKGISYGLKARIHHLLGERQTTEESFKLAMKEYASRPQNIFQLIHMQHDTIYYAAFLSRNYGSLRAEDVKRLLGFDYWYLREQGEAVRRNIRHASMLVAARDSREDDYPSFDFNRKDIDNFYSIFPSIKPVFEELDLEEYARGNPLEERVRNRVR